MLYRQYYIIVPNTTTFSSIDDEWCIEQNLGGWMAPHFYCACAAHIDRKKTCVFNHFRINVITRNSAAARN